MGTLTHKLQFNATSVQGREFGALETSERLDTVRWGLQLLPVPQVPSPSLPHISFELRLLGQPSASSELQMDLAWSTVQGSEPPWCQPRRCV